MEAKKAEPRDSRTPSVIGGNTGMGRGMAAMQNPYAPGNGSHIQTSQVALCATVLVTQ